MRQLGDLPLDVAAAGTPPAAHPIVSNLPKLRRRGRIAGAAVAEIYAVGPVVSGWLTGNLTQL